MATTNSIPQQTTVSARIQLATAQFLYNHFALIVDQLDEDIRTLSHEALDAYDADNMRPGQLVSYLRQWSDELLVVRKTREMVARHRRHEAISIVRWAARVAVGRSLPGKVEEIIGDYTED